MCLSFDRIDSEKEGSESMGRSSMARSTTGKLQEDHDTNTERQGVDLPFDFLHEDLACCIWDHVFDAVVGVGALSGNPLYSCQERRGILLKRRLG